MKKKLFSDIILNVIATIIPIIILQIVILPKIAIGLGALQYGNVLFLISIFTIIAFPLGNTFNNIRLLKHEKYIKNSYDGDFNTLISIVVIGATIFFVVYSNLYLEINTYSKILISIIILLSIVKEYYIVTFRLSLSFKKIFLNNLILSLGYLLGLMLFIYTKKWEYVYLIGFVLSNIYILFNTNLIKEPLKKTPFFKGTLVDSILLYISSLLKNLITHADKLLLFPLLGPINVAIYYAATIIGKILSMFVGPINSVVLSYLVKTERKVNINVQLLISGTVGVLFYLFIIIAGPTMLDLLYPDWAKESSELLKYTAASAIITVLSGLFQPFNLRFNKMKWQLYINGSHIIIYMIFTIILTNLYGLIGFSIGVLISSIYNLIIQIFIYRYAGKE